MRIIQVSDTHLSTRHAHFARNVEIIRADIAARAATADLIIHTGDVSMDGAVDRRDLDLARSWLDGLPADTLALPGNHDVGDLPTLRADQALDDVRLAAFADCVGADRWVHDAGGWRLIGLNAMLFATGHAQEEAQFAWLETVLTDDRPIALFTHKPLCIDDLAEGPCGYWTVAPEPRARLLALLAGKPVKLIASGHLHIERDRRIAGIPHFWCPAASFVVGELQQDLGGVRRLGYAEHCFDGDTVTSRFVRPDGLEDLPIDPVHSEIYPA